MRVLTDKAQFAVEFLDLPSAARFPDAVWEPYQIAFLNTRSRFSLDAKARQVGWSFTCALDAVIDGILYPETPHIFVSINLEEAKEKIRYVNAVIEALDPPVRPKIVRDSQTTIELENGSRFVSHPCKAPRGKARARIYLDEAAHYPLGLDHDIYVAALPATTRGDGYIRIGSSPRGASGLFWEIETQSTAAYPGFVRRRIPWWLCRPLCNDVQTAARLAPLLTLDERIEQFASLALRQIYANMFTEDFRQEYECEALDESSAWISWHDIEANQQGDLVSWHVTTIDAAYDLLDKLRSAIVTGQIESVLCGGIDVGRTRDLTEFAIVGQSTTGQLPCRAMVSLDNVAFDQQRALFETLITNLPFSVVLIDSTGIGMQLAEELSASTSVTQPIVFTAQVKELLAVHTRIAFERRMVPLPIDRDLAYQIHSIRRQTTAAKNIRFDVQASEKHHADKFWALALAIYGATMWGNPNDYIVRPQ